MVLHGANVFNGNLSMKQYTCKFDVNIWFDRNFAIEASSQEEAEQKAKELMSKTEYELYAQINPKQELDFKQLHDWVFGDLKLDTVHVVED